jgi:hypothetical protein
MNPVFVSENPDIWLRRDSTLLADIGSRGRGIGPDILKEQPWIRMS